MVSAAVLALAFTGFFLAYSQAMRMLDGQRQTSRAVVTFLTERLTKGISRRVVHSLIRTLIPPIVKEISATSMSALSFGLAMSLTRALTRSPKQDAQCAECGEDMNEYKIAPVGENKDCNLCLVSKWNDYYTDYFTTYYTEYFYGYYGYYYTNYFSQVFADEQLAKLEEAAGDGGE